MRRFWQMARSGAGLMVLCWISACEISLAGELPTCTRPNFSAARGDTLDPLPRWDYVALYDKAPFGPGRAQIPAWENASIVSVRLLAWYRATGPGFLVYKDHALLWLKLDPGTGAGPAWALVHLLNASNSEGRWLTPSPIPGVRDYPVATFGYPPNNDDIYLFIGAHTGWQFDQAGPSNFSSGDVRDRTWFQVVGEQPRLHFPSEVAECF